MFAWTNDGTPARLAVDAFNALAKPSKWNNIGSRIEFLPNDNTKGRVLMQVYPTYFLYYNRQHSASDTQFQAERPLDNFNQNPYPPGPAPFIKP